MKITLTLPEGLESYVATQVVSGGYPSAGDYILDLIRQSQQDRERELLEQQLLAGVESLDRGEGKPMTSADWDRLRGRLEVRSGDVVHGARDLESL